MLFFLIGGQCNMTYDNFVVLLVVVSPILSTCQVLIVGTNQIQIQKKNKPVF
jgi:hypothetical protein